MKNTVHFGGVFAQCWDNFHLHVNGRFILDEIGEMLSGKTCVNEKTLMGGFKYKGKERGEGEYNQVAFNNHKKATPLISGSKKSTIFGCC